MAKQTNGSSDPSASARHSCESGNPASLTINSGKSLDPRFRGDDGNDAWHGPTAVPRLRFPEFQNRGGWPVKSLGAEATFEKGRGVSKADVDPNGIHLCIRYGELYTRYGEVIREVFSKTNGDDSVLFLSRANDVIVPASGETKADIATASCVLLSDVALGGDLNVIRSRHNGIFLSYFLNGSKRTELAKVAQGDTIVHLYPSQLAALSIAFPEIAEQQKIANCLTSLDEVIAAQGRKVEALKAHKRGLMQQLFPGEGETRPRLRFPEFRNAPEWCEQSFAKLYEFMPTNIFSRDQLNYAAGTVRNIHYGDIHTKFATQFRIEEEEAPYVNARESLARIKPAAYCKEGDMVFADASEDLTDVGKSIELVRLNGEKLLSGSHTILARQRQADLVLGFGSYLFKSRSIRAQIEKEAQGTKVMSISPNRLAGIAIRFPREKVEQQRIADCLSSLDTQITAESNQLAALKTHKQGLMQQLFPNSEAVHA